VKDLRWTFGPAVVVAAALAAGTLPGAAQTKILPGALTPGVIQRLNANGLQANDSQLEAKLQALAQSNGHAPIAGPPPTIHLTKPSGAKQVVFDQPISIIPIALNPKGSTPTASPKPQPTATAPIITKVTIDAYDYNYENGNPLPVIIVDGENLGQGGNPDRRPKLDMPNCGAGLVSLYTASYPGEPWYAVDFTVPKNEAASLTMTYHGTSKPVALTIPSYSGIAVMNYTAPVGDVAPFFLSDALGEKSASYASSATSHRSTNVNGSASSGTDTLGLGTSLLNGWTASATVTNIRSYRDSSSESGASDEFRSAQIVQQPALGRLETKVAWKFQAGESISYDVVWSLSKGVFGTRPVSTLSKDTSCSDEQ
jgi:hypothetical protein